MSHTRLSLREIRERSDLEFRREAWRRIDSLLKQRPHARRSRLVERVARSYDRSLDEAETACVHTLTRNWHIRHLAGHAAGACIVGIVLTGILIVIMLFRGEVALYYLEFSLVAFLAMSIARLNRAKRVIAELTT